jgi:hypothetical protein
MAGQVVSDADLSDDFFNDESDFSVDSVPVKSVKKVALRSY